MPFSDKADEPDDPPATQPKGRLSDLAGRERSEADRVDPVGNNLNPLRSHASGDDDFG